MSCAIFFLKSFLSQMRQKLKLTLIQKMFHKDLFVINVSIHHIQNLSYITHILNDQCQIIFKGFTVLVLEHIMQF